MARGTPTEARQEMSALDKEIAAIHKDFGAGSIITSSTLPEHVDVISTGSIGLDKATGIGGLPRGKIVEIMGWESSGKSTICLQVIANAQKQGLKALLIDGENSFDATYAKNLGINIEDLLIQQLDEGGAEKCYNIAERILKTKQIGVVVIDSQTSLLPKKALDGEIGDSNIGIHARLMSQSVPKIMGAAMLGNALVIYVSQFREKIGVMFGSPETTNGGNALKFYSHMRLEVRKSVIKKDDIAVGNKTKVKVIKNKLARPFETAEFVINYGEGVDTTQEIVDIATDKGIITKSGSWYSYGGNNIGQGEAAVIALLNDNPELKEEIKNKL